MFSKVLVANRGEIACRVLRTCERLGIRSVAVFSDADVGAPHVALADEAIRLGAARVQDSYLNIDALVEAVRASGADAVHPGYGLLSESPAFAQAVTASGACFVGPSCQAMALLGDKVAARSLARSVGLSPPPGSETAVMKQQAHDLAAGIGYPLLVKAAAGGGGIGMQLVADAAGLDHAVEVAKTRAHSAFGDARIYLEKYLQRPRHIELQLLRDQMGRTLTLGERECSVQRRHQKLIEESPSPSAFLATAAGVQLLQEQTAKAERLLEVCQYVGIATVEFMLDGTGQLYFLEVNARLQVEHPVTELRSKLDLVEVQFAIASGQQWPSAWLKPKLEGHAVEARIYAEDPARNFLPQPGRVVRLRLPEGEGIRVDAGIAEGLEVTSHYDPLLLKVIAHAVDRKQAIARLDQALAELLLEVEGKRGKRQTNQAFLRQVLASESFRSGNYDTALVQEVLEASA